MLIFVHIGPDAYRRLVCGRDATVLQEQRWPRCVAGLHVGNRLSKCARRYRIADRVHVSERRAISAETSVVGCAGLNFKRLYKISTVFNFLVSADW
jgi:hypothetical protein